MNRQPKFSLFEGCLSMTVALTIDDPFEVTNAIVWPLVFVELQLNYSNYSCILTTEVFFLSLDKYNCIISLVFGNPLHHET